MKYLLTVTYKGKALTLCNELTTWKYFTNIMESYKSKYESIVNTDQLESEVLHVTTNWQHTPNVGKLL